MRILVVGDIHGDFGALNILINKKQPDILIQVGDHAYMWMNQWNYGKIKPGNTKVFLIPGNHECISRRTEVLTENGWKRIDSITLDDKIASKNFRSGYIEYNKPKGIIKRFSKDILNISSKNYLQECTENHQIFYDNKKVIAKTLLNSNKLLKQSLFLQDLNFNNIQDYNISDSELKLIVWVVGDGTLVDCSKYENTSVKKRVQFKLSRKDKIDELTNLLKKSNIKFTFKKCKKGKYNKLQPYYIRIYSDYARRIFDLLDNKKQFPSFFRKLSKRQINIVLTENLKVDGYTQTNRMFFKSTNKNDADLIQELCLRFGYFSYMRKIKQNKKAFGTKELYDLTIYKNKTDIVNYKISMKTTEYNDYVYCITIKNSNFIIRTEGKICLTGNCWTMFEEHVGRNGLAPKEMEKNIYYCPIGSYIQINGKTVLFVGGADSYDKQYRHEHIDWFRQEVLNDKDLDFILKNHTKADIIISHTCPWEFDMQEKSYQIGKSNDPSRHVLSYLLKEYSPYLYFFGHWHQYRFGTYQNKETHKSTKWIGLDCETGNGKWWHLFEID